MAVRGNSEHEASMEAQSINEIDLVVVNLYAFEACVAKGSNFETCIENIDIGGPSMLRSSAKNHAYVVCLLWCRRRLVPDFISSMQYINCFVRFFDGTGVV